LNYSNIFEKVDNNLTRIRIKDIAELAGVSPGTVDRVLHDRGEVSATTREKILGIINDMDYHPDILASTLANKKEIRIAALIPQGKYNNPFWKYPLKGIEEGLLETSHFGLSVDKYLFDYSDRGSFIGKAAEMFNSRPRGVILAPVFTEDAAIVIEKCNSEGIPVVLINANICDGGCLAFVGQDSLQSGMVAARLMHYGLDKSSDILIVNFIREKGNQEHILKREEGFRKYFSAFTEYDESRLKQLNIIENEISDYQGILKEAVLANPQTGGIFVTNSRVFRVAEFLQSSGILNCRLIGYDLLDENKKYLKSGIIDFLISQKPREQGYKSLLALYHHLILKKPVEKNQYLPIDIITRENLGHYTFT
jgi:LacI family transcriptional regulator